MHIYDLYGSIKLIKSIDSMTITPINKDDLYDLSNLYEELSDIKSNISLVQSNFAQIEKNENYYLLGAKIDNKLVGSLMGIHCLDLVGECRPFMIIENVIVSNTHRSKGIGKELMNEIENIAKYLDCYYIIFVSSNERKNAHKFYESMGYDKDKVKGFKKFL